MSNVVPLVPALPPHIGGIGDQDPTRGRRESRPAVGTPEQWQTMWRDIRVVVEDLAKAGWGKGRLKKTFGLSWAELRKMLGRW